MASTRIEPIRVLVVDDEELDRQAVRRNLRQAGVDARIDDAASGSAALERVGASSYDCVLLDYYLPGEDSMSLLRELRERVPGTPVVIFTGRGDEDLAVELMKNGAADYLPKGSLSPERLTAAIRHAREVARAAIARDRAERLLRLSSDAAQHLLTAGTADDLMRDLFGQIREPLEIDAWFSYRLDALAGCLRRGSSGGIADEHVRTVAEVPFPASDEGEEIAAAVRQTELRITRGISQFGFQTCSCQPLFSRKRMVGVLCFASRTRDAFTADELDFFRTISRYAMAAWERLRYIDEMRESDRRKDEFLATLAHELRDPLAPLSNVLELLKIAHDDSSVLEQARDTMERQLGQLVQLVDDLLDMSRITRSRLDLHKSRVDLGSVVQHAVETARPLVQSFGHRFQVALPQEPVYLDADPVRLAQVLGNLLTNACKYTERSGDIALIAEAAGSSVVVTVRDSGIGIPQDELNAVFDMFSQVPEARKLSQGGLGIGLTLVRRLVAMHGGSVEARSEGAGCGSEFIVRLPISAPAAEAQVPDVVASAPDTSGRRILIVDDNKDTAASLAMLLGMTGNTVREAYDGIAAVEAAAEFLPDLVLLDIGLPRMDGFEVCRRIRAESWGRDMFVVALSGWGQEGDRRKSQDAGFDHHLVKPVKYDELTRLLAAGRPSQKAVEDAGSADASG